VYVLLMMKKYPLVPKKYLARNILIGKD
jgi:hypothetical protein